MRPAGGAQGPDLRSRRRWVGWRVRPTLPPSPACGAEAWRRASGRGEARGARRAAARGRTRELVCARPRGITVAARGVRAGAGRRERGGSEGRALLAGAARWCLVGRPRCLRTPGPGRGDPLPSLSRACRAEPSPLFGPGLAQGLGGRGVRLQRVLVLWAPPRFSGPGGSPAGVLVPSGSAPPALKSGRRGASPPLPCGPEGARHEAEASRTLG